jgi:hypothetical protein
MRARLSILAGALLPAEMSPYRYSLPFVFGQFDHVLLHGGSPS